MEPRLSAIHLKKKYDTGFNHLQLKKAKSSSDLVVLDIQGLLARPDYASVIPTIPAQQIYLALKAEGIEDNRDILAYLSSEQLTRIMDYDCWPEQRLERKRAFEWLKYFNDFGPEALYRAYRGLDEEYQISLLQGLIRVYDEEEIEKLPHDHRDQLFPFAGHELFFDILSEDESVIDFVLKLVNSCQAGKMEYAMSLLQHATFDIPNEPEHLLNQFRNARLEEDGFVTIEEAHSTFLPFNIEAYRRRWQKLGELFKVDDATIQSLAIYKKEHRDVLFLDLVRQASIGKWDLDTALSVHQRMVILANHICTACDIGPHQTEEIKEVFEQSQGLLSLGLEFASEHSLEKAAGILSIEQPKVLFRTGVTLIHLVRKKLIQEMKQRNLPFAAKLEQLNEKGQFGQMQWFLDTECFGTLGFELTEKLKGLFNRFPMCAEREHTSGRFTFEPIGNLEVLNNTAEHLANELQRFNLHH